MKPADYKCRGCNIIFEIWIKDNEDFLEYVSCKNCGLPCMRSYTPAFSIVHQGKCGNKNNGYKSNSVKIKKT